MYHSVEDAEGKIPFFAGIDKAKFRKPVKPGDRLKVKAEVIRLRDKIGKISAESFVDGQLAAEAELMFVIQENE
jgi:3-hydroxyacyl-[acyl-carrier-protein] dehydratase